MEFFQGVNCQKIRILTELFLDGSLMVFLTLGMDLNGAWDINGNLRSANLLPCKEYTGYQAMNSVIDFSNPERWQPGLTVLDRGIYR